MLTRIQSRQLIRWGLLLIVLGTEIAAARPRIGLVLSGGGARGAAHIGVLKVLEDLRVPVDAIAATSMGAIVGGAYAAGVPVAEMENIVTNVDWQDIFDDNPSRQLFSNRRKNDDRQNYSATIGLGSDGVKLPQGAVIGQKLDLFLRDLVARAARQTDFDQLPIPFRAVATNLVNGEMVIFAGGRLNDAMRASMSVPGLIAPTEIDGRLLVDGGLVRNLPVAIARQMGVDRIIAVNLGTSLLERSELNSVLGVTVQMLTILTEQNVQASLASLNDNDVLILPELGTISSADFPRAAEAIASGEQAARNMAPALRRFSLSAAQYQRWRDQRLMQSVTAPSSMPVTISEIRIENLDRVNPRALTPLIKTRPGDTLDQNTLDQDLSRLYGSGDFDRLSYRLLDDPDDSRAVVIDAFEKDWGPNYLRFGIGFSADLQDSNDYRFRFSYLRTWVNPRGAEWQTDVQLGSNPQLDSEFYQPLSAGKPWFVAPFIGLSDRREDIFRDDNIIAEYDVITASAGVDLGLDLRERGELRLGLLFRAIDAEVGIGDPDLPTLTENNLGVQLRYGRDQLDNANFPTTGSAFGARLYATSDTLGTDQSYSTLALQGLKAFSLSDRGTLLAGLRLGARLDQTIPVYDEFTLGGFLRLSGLQNDQLRGQYLGLGTLAYTYRLGNLGGDFGGGIYAGASLEAGNVWNSSDEIAIDNLRIGGSAFIGADSLIGPLYLAFGLSEGGAATPYIMLGRALR